jgi:hypothetical protein
MSERGEKTTQAQVNRDSNIYTRQAKTGSGPTSEETGATDLAGREFAWLIRTARELGKSIILSKLEKLALVAEDTAAALHDSARDITEKGSPVISRYCELTGDGFKTVAAELRGWDPEQMVAGSRRLAESHPFIFLSGAMAAGLVAFRKGESDSGKERGEAVVPSRRQSGRMRAGLAKFARENPFALGVFAFSTGAVLGAALPAIRTDRLSGQKQQGLPPVTGGTASARLAREREIEMTARLDSRSQAGGFGPEEKEVETESAW